MAAEEKRSNVPFFWLFASALIAFALGMLVQWRIAEYQLKARPCSVRAWDVNTKSYLLISQPYTQCVLLSERRQYSGIWNDEYEGQIFFQNQEKWIKRWDGVNPDDYRLDPNQTWLAMDTMQAYKMANVEPDHATRRQFLIIFVGRESLERGEYGHFGMSSRVIVVDEIISLKPVLQPDVQ